MSKVEEEEEKKIGWFILKEVHWRLFVVLFPIYLRYHPDGLGGSVKPAHQKLLLPTPKIPKYNLTLNLKNQPA